MADCVFICYERCTTCKKAEKWLCDHGIGFEKRPIKEQNPSKDELRDWAQRGKIPLRRLFNTSGQIYREQGLSKRLPGMGEEEQLDLLASSGMLVKRPLLIKGDTILVGFKEAEWAQALL
ncbi:MAG: arsenate reductase family protein [Succinivibrionaceae bacterium]|nr:arsenate reductase family protein [Succinivibrionaceae bacterium]